VPEVNILSITRISDLSIGITNSVINITNALESAYDLAGPWNTVTVWQATSFTTNLTVPSTNTTEFFRVKSEW
jgi:hypothetical protein